MIVMHSNSKIKYIALAVSVFAICFAYGDIISGPVQQDFPLHRIGIEFVLTSLAASLGGSAVLKWRLKRGWKFEKSISKKERKALEAKLKSAKPILSRCCIALHLLDDLGGATCRNQKDRVNLILRLNPELVKELEGVPVEWVDSAIQELYFYRDDEIRSSPVSFDDGMVVLAEGYWASPEEYREQRTKRTKNRRRGSLYDRMRRGRRIRRIIFFMLILGIAFCLAWWLGQRF